MKKLKYIIVAALISLICIGCTSTITNDTSLKAFADKVYIWENWKPTTTTVETTIIK